MINEKFGMLDIFIFSVSLYSNNSFEFESFIYISDVIELIFKEFNISLSV